MFRWRLPIDARMASVVIYRSYLQGLEHIHTWVVSGQTAFGEIPPCADITAFCPLPGEFLKTKKCKGVGLRLSSTGTVTRPLPQSRRG